ncbi:hypothetical protein TrCOL_g6542 [Triparma columacea]|uniref:Cytochrome b-c1 complex subunit 9 n=1 Tax=Triparma columacea TaxID=722753 RepID=A0A9W7LC15_9STRA|nr:hypothetical protein TrCOL_g6542 [Triparma columacea]
MRQAQQKRNMTFIPGGVLRGFYDTIAKNNFSYILFIVAGIIVTENIYGSAVDAVWASKNNGKTFDTIDWSVFAEDDEEEEEEEEDDDE